MKQISQILVALSVFMFILFMCFSSISARATSETSARVYVIRTHARQLRTCVYEFEMTYVLNNEQYTRNITYDAYRTYVPNTYVVHHVAYYETCTKRTRNVLRIVRHIPGVALFIAALAFVFTLFTVTTRTHER